MKMKRYEPFVALQGNTPAGQVCDAIGLCHNATVASNQLSTEIVVPQSQPEPVQNDLVCVLCLVEMQEIVSKHIGSNVTYEEFVKNLEAGCAKYPKFKAECDAVVLLYGKDMYNAITVRSNIRQAYNASAHF